MSAKKALIVGCKGQDGVLLTRELLAKEYTVVGIDQFHIESSAKIEWDNIDILDYNQVFSFLSTFSPDEIFYLPAFHHSSQDSNLAEQPLFVWNKSIDIHVLGLINFLESMRLCTPKSKLFYASSSLIFGFPDQAPQTEQTPLKPECIYGITKTTGMQSCYFYRKEYSIFASIGILYNHESHLRTEGFLSQKIIQGAKRIKKGTQKELVLGNLSARTDWGYAPDYVEAIWRILQIDKPEDFIIATGETHSVFDWVKLSFEKVGLNWNDYVHEDKSLITRRKATLVGDNSKLNKYTGWQPKTSFEEMISLMMG